jgi:hypothetical protein
MAESTILFQRWTIQTELLLRGADKVKAGSYNSREDRNQHQAGVVPLATQSSSETKIWFEQPMGTRPLPLLRQFEDGFNGSSRIE